jgi:hypothetical protein
LPVAGCAMIVGLRTPRPGHCTNGIQDGDETGIDCGGECAACDGASCNADDDCAGLSCRAGRCAPLECPGSDCVLCHTCSAGTQCVFDSDCETDRCYQQVCAPCTTGEDCASGVCEVDSGTCSR